MGQVRRSFIRREFHYICELPKVYRGKEISEFGRRHRLGLHSSGFPRVPLARLLSLKLGTEFTK